MSQTAKFQVTVPYGTGTLSCGPYTANVLEGSCDLNSFFAMVNGNHPGVFSSITGGGNLFELECANVVNIDPNMPPSGYDNDGTVQLSIWFSGSAPVAVLRRNEYVPEPTE